MANFLYMYNFYFAEHKSPENVSSEVLNTILMLAGVASQGSGSVNSENINLLNLVNNKIIENKEQQKIQLKHCNIETQKNFMGKICKLKEQFFSKNNANNYEAIDRNPGRNIAENLASGGSSPSREVQEIMSLQEYDKCSYNGDEMLEKSNQSVTKTNSPAAVDKNVLGCYNY